MYTCRQCRQEVQSCVELGSLYGLYAFFQIILRGLFRLETISVGQSKSSIQAGTFEVSNNNCLFIHTPQSAPTQPSNHLAGLKQPRIPAGFASITSQAGPVPNGARGLFLAAGQHNAVPRVTPSAHAFSCHMCSPRRVQTTTPPALEGC